MQEITKLELGAMPTNTYIVHNEYGTILVDPAAESGRIKAFLTHKGWKADAVLLTHGHYDHIMGVDTFADIPLYAHAVEETMLHDPKLNLSAEWAEPYAVQREISPLQEGDTLYGFTVLHTPGHTIGSICLYSEEEKTLLCGDTLFKNGFGRTDLPGGSLHAIYKSVARLYKLPEDVYAYPGHGENFNIGEEKRRHRIK